VHLWLALQLRGPQPIERRRELYDDGLRANKGAHGFHMEALGMLRFEPPAPNRRADGHGNLARQGIKVISIFGPHITSMLMTILSVSVLLASPCAFATACFAS